MKGYIEDGAWLSCSFDLAATPRQLKRHLDQEDKKVQYSSGKRLLTVLDKNTSECFKCKLAAKKWGGLLSLVGGIVVGVALIFSGPVGWIALGALVVVAVGTTVAVFAHDCAEPQSGGEWINFHDTTYIKGKQAILYNKSILECKDLGLLIASETEAQAQAVSDKMKWQARGELGLQILSNALIGVTTGYGMFDKSPQGLDMDLSTGPLAVASYIHTDFVHPEYNWKQSTLVGLGYTSANFGLGSVHRIQGMPNWSKHLGTEISLQDIGIAALTTGIGAGSDYLEGKLSDSSNSVIQELSDNVSQTSGKKIVSSNY